MLVHSLNDRRAIQIKNGAAIAAELEGNSAAWEFAALLPLSLKFEDYNNTGKISDLPKRLTCDGAPAAITPKSGDIAFYAPWGNLAVFIATAAVRQDWSN